MLWFAAAAGDDLRIMYITACGIDVRATDYDRRSALHLAASNGHLSTTLYLLALGADVHFLDRHGNSALDDARREGHEEVLELLLAYEMALQDGGMDGGLGRAKGAGGYHKMGRNWVPRCTPAESIILYLTAIKNFATTAGAVAGAHQSNAVRVGDSSKEVASSTQPAPSPTAKISIPKIPNSRPLLASVIHWCKEKQDGKAATASQDSWDIASDEFTSQLADDLADDLASRLSASLASSSASVFVSAFGTASSEARGLPTGRKALQQPKASREALLTMLRDRGLGSSGDRWIWVCR
jgi:ankyrin repeat protein